VAANSEPRGAVSATPSHSTLPSIAVYRVASLEQYGQLVLGEALLEEDVVADEGTVDRDGFKLDWVREGRGLPLMVLGARWFYPRYFPQALRDHFEIVFCDLRQWAATPEGFDISTITLDTLCEDVEALRQASGLERPIVAGQSQHGAMALAYARHAPHEVRGAAAIAAPPPQRWWEGIESPEDFFARDASPERRAADQRNKSTRPTHEPARTSQEFIENYVAQGAIFWYDPTFDCTPMWDGVEINVPVMHQVTGPDGIGGLPLDGLDVPVFLALGRYDYAIPFYVWDEARKTVPDLRYKLYDRSAHQPPCEQPEEFTTDLVEWAGSL
jgi:proline iminopeptidase